MNNAEAREVLGPHLARYRTLSYDELVRRQGRVETAELTAASGQTYQLEVQFICVSSPDGGLHRDGFQPIDMTRFL
jgi:hypothetical protein